MSEQTPLTSGLPRHEHDPWCPPCVDHGKQDAARQPAPEAGLREVVLRDLVIERDGVLYFRTANGVPMEMSKGQRTRLRRALDAPAPDDATHLAWLREGDRLARALHRWQNPGSSGECSALFDKHGHAAAAIIAALAGEPQPKA